MSHYAWIAKYISNINYNAIKNDCGNEVLHTVSHKCKQNVILMSDIDVSHN